MEKNVGKALDILAECGGVRCKDKRRRGGCLVFDCAERPVCVGHIAARRQRYLGLGDEYKV